MIFTFSVIAEAPCFTFFVEMRCKILVSTYHYLPILIFRLLSYMSVFFYLFLTLWLEKIPIGFLNSAFLTPSPPQSA